MKLTILGGGGFRVPLIHSTLLNSRCQDGGRSTIDELSLFDVDQGRQASIAAVLRDQAADHPNPPRVSVHSDIHAALDGADFVFSAIRVGGTAGRMIDERIALDHGVVGQETVGAAGLAYALRTIPVSLSLARSIARQAPNAWTINFTNPAGVITEAMSAVLGPRVIGICDSPVGLIRHAAEAVGADANDTVPDYVGLNHLGWLRALRLDGHDVLPTLLADAAALGTFEEGRLLGADCVQTIGALPNEYLHYYYRTREALQADLTADAPRGAFLDLQQRRFYTEVRAADHAPLRVWKRALLEREQTYMATNRAAAGGFVRAEGDLVSGGYDKVALRIMEAIAHDRAATLIVNTPQGHLFGELPHNAVVEVPCRVDARGATPLPTDPLPEYARGLMVMIKQVEQDIITATTCHSRRHALRAFADHPLVDSFAVATSLLDAYQRQHAALSYLQ